MLKGLLLSGILLLSSTLNGQELRDPTRPLDWQQSAATNLRAAAAMELSNIRFSESRRWAIINEQRVQVGDQVNGYRVTQIAPNHVELVNSEGERVELTLFSSLKQVVKEDGL